MNRFVVFCQARTGTHLLRTSLEQHPAVRCAWESFNDKAIQHFTYDRDTPAHRILEQLWCDESGIRAAGFPLHLSHGRDGRAWGEVWQLLSDDPSLIRLHLYRRNLLEQLISHTLALRTGNWMQEETEAAAPQASTDTLTLEPEYCREWFTSTAEAVSAQHHSMPDALTISYEELSTELTTTVASLFQRLGVTPVAVQAKTRKQGRPAEATLENFEQLLNTFADTPWQSFFDKSHPHIWDTDVRRP